MMAEFDPGDSTIEEVNAHLEKNPGDAQRVLDAEKAGQNRVTLVSSLEEQLKSVPEKAGSPAVEVKAAEPTREGTTASDRRETIHGNEYTVTPDRGYRRS